MQKVKKSQKRGAPMGPRGAMGPMGPKGLGPNHVASVCGTFFLQEKARPNKKQHVVIEQITIVGYFGQC